LDFAAEQSRTDTGTLIRDLIAYSEPNRHPIRWQIGTRSDRNRHWFRSKSAPLFRVS
jgi:hypothetical protein